MLLGPNGSGKTRLSTRITGAELTRVPALRNLSQLADIPFQPPKQALDQLNAQEREQLSNVWTLASDVQWSLSLLLAKDSQSARDYRDAVLKSGVSAGLPEETALISLLKIWNNLFPGRYLSFENHQPSVTNVLSGTSRSYAAQTMSDGERVALYVTARILNARPGIIVVDEPELHLHSLLARRLWTLLELLRVDCRFVYITHDLPFALSRRGATYVVVRDEGDYQVVTKDADLPEYVFRDTIGAATITIQAAKALFCEGTAGKDDVLYDALLSRHGFHVVAVGSCSNVDQCVDAFREVKIVRGADANGIVDRDFWPDARLNNLRTKGVHPIEVHEVEALYLLQSCFVAVARQLLMDESTANQRFDDFVCSARNQAASDEVRVAVERAKQRIYDELSKHLDKVSYATPTNARSGIELAFAARTSAVDAGKVFDEEMLATVSAARGGNVADLLRIFPGKALVGLASQVLGVSREKYCELLEKLVRDAGPGSPLLTDLYAVAVPWLALAPPTSSPP